MTAADLARSPVPRSALAVSSVTRRFASTTACHDVSFAVAPGEILGLLGENGAGKSTLLSIISGMQPADHGAVSVDGQSLPMGDPGRAIRAGIGTVYQHFSQVPTFTVAEQFRLRGGDATAGASLLAGIDRHRPLSTLSMGERQRVEIAQVLAGNPRVLLLDEPTSILSDMEVESLFARLRTLRDAGGSVVLVSHRLREVLSIADRIVVMRRGRIVDEIAASRDGSGRWPDDVDARLLRSMFGALVNDPDAAAEAMPAVAEVAAAKRRPEPTISAVHGEATSLLAAHGLTSTRPDGRHQPRQVTFDLAAGEKLAIVGIDGQGQRALAEMLAGYLPFDGRLTIDGHALVPAHPNAFASAGIRYLTDDRRGDGGVATMTVRDNLLLKHQHERQFSALGVLRIGQIRRAATAVVDDWQISPSDPSTPYGALSGGNQQKVLLARELGGGARVLIASNPTHGLDVQTQRLVWGAVDRLLLGGGAVVIFTTDLAEAMERADRIAILHRGRLSSPVAVGGASVTDLAQMVVNGW